MKGLRFGSKIIFIINSLVAFLLLISYILPYIPPKSFASLSVLSLGVPLLILFNALFFLYWLLRVRKQFLLSLIVLLLGWNYINSMYKFSRTKAVEDEANFTVMSFNVRLFNRYEWLPSKEVKEDIIELILNEQPDILSLQEYRTGDPIDLEGYYNFNGRHTEGIKAGQTIFSKFPIVNSGSLEFPNTYNNAIFADIVKGKDTIRVYSFHLQSSGIQTDVEKLKDETSGHLFKQVRSTFRAQQDQVELFLAHKSKSNYKTIVTGDFNNTAYSYIYRMILGDDLKDSFEEAGNGFGRTYDFKFFPLRIDFILVDKDFTVNGFKLYEEKLSDHYPIKATLKLH
ncbi:endonuclease/exonuclease/phosphatase family metal-dependent hydrolase [Winogradskyella epiphytica]|uniref:Endonuclease/exonuclease/phosphatase family metal-dependent hydrolase n=1 Tax=Winogradskyella epiphytica TaxID=262005 RepID=A0A2V4WYJ3_9FLAO|nr:endonuclease/exonuclease/phosphatase family protein [Winogradskyella epiphytica]PYE82092.1 endonuclease/exonuclease/phosphatase family metal-dependent hydrolase [Winogradskyella epiphytica]GGW60597.1 endonuclease [Winogradskyella epiphytica]